jgi:hypothetical protein
MNRRYSDREVGLILQRALEPAGRGQALEAAGEGLTLDEIKEIAAEVGIDPGQVEMAAASLLEPDAAPINPYAGIPTTVQLQTTLPHSGLQPDQLSEVLTLIRSVQHRQGLTGSEFGSLEWRAKDVLGARYVSVMPTQDGLRVRVLGNFRDGLFAIAAIAGALGLATGAVVTESLGLGGWSFPILAAAAALPPRFAYRWLRRKEDARLREVFDRLVAFLGASERPPEDPREDDALLTPPDTL